MIWKLRCKPARLIASYCPSYKKQLTWRKKPLKKNISPGVLSPNAARKIKQSIRWLIACSDTKKVYEKKYKRLVNWKINLATLTFRENLQDDNKGRQILAQWLDMAKHRFDLQQYVWKAEPQERGAIHFHLITNTYIPFAELNYTWNRLLRKHELNNIDDNSTDIHAVTQAKNLEAYLTDYMTNDKKHAGRRLITGRLWGCSHSLSQAGKKYLILDKDELIELSNDLHRFSLETILRKEGKEVPQFLQYGGYWIMPENYFTNLPACELKQMWFDEIAALRNKNQKQLFPNSF